MRDFRFQILVLIACFSAVPLTAENKPEPKAPPAQPVAHAEPAAVASSGRSEAPETKRRLSFFEGKDEVTWGFAGEVPSVDIFNDDPVQRGISSQINETVYAEETDPLLRKRIHRGDALKVTFDGLTFRKVKGNPELVELIIVGPIRTGKVVQKISLKDLEAGKSFLDIPLSKVGRYLVGIGSASGTGKISFHYDRAAGRIVVDEFRADFSLKFGFTLKDGDSLNDLKLVPKDLSPRPEMEAKYLLK